MCIKIDGYDIIKMYFEMVLENIKISLKFYKWKELCFKGDVV